MSGLAKGIKKIFKRVVNVARAVAPVLLPAAAVYFTAGAGAPLLGNLSNALGGGVLGSVVSNAALGAGVGGLSSLLTGGNPLQGAALGAAAGGALGGLMTPATPAAPAAPRDLLTGSAAQDTLAGGVISGGTGIDSTGLGQTARAAAPAGSGVLGAGGFLPQSRLLAGNLLLGLGQGLALGDPGEGELRVLREQRKIARQNYGMGLAPGYRMVADADAPGARDPSLGLATWRYDRQQGRIVRDVS